MKKIWMQGKKGLGMFALVDDDDYEKANQWNWHIGNDGYAMGYVRQKGGNPVLTSMHRYLVTPPRWLVVDHKNRIKLDNRRSNLRVCTHKQNSGNRKIHHNNRTGYAGVSYVARDKLWRATVGLESIGYFKTKGEAIIARTDAAKKMYGAFANIIYPIEVFSLSGVDRS